VVGLNEDGADQSGDDLPVAVMGCCHQVAHGVDSAALPRCSLEHPLDCCFQAGMSIRDHQLHSAQASVFEVTEELGPECFVLGIADVDAEDFTVPIGSESGGDHHGLGDNLMMFADMQVGGIQPDVDERLMIQATFPQYSHVGVDLFADTRHR
jgi:hypothetical protein